MSEKRVLILTSSFQPHRVVSWERAVIMLFKGGLNVLEEYDEILYQKGDLVIRTPAVAALTKPVTGMKRAVKFSRVNVFTRDNFKCQYCLSPDHKVLTADLRWVPLGEVQLADRLVGFDEELVSSGGRRFTQAHVETHQFEVAPLYRVTLEDGTTFKVTAEHRWLGRTSEGAFLQWFDTLSLLGKQVPRLFHPWEEETTKEAGWLAGIFDGEGWLAKRGMVLGVAQNPGATLDSIKQRLSDRGFEFGEGRVSGTCQRISIEGTYRDKARLLGQIRPQRLLSSFKVESLGRVQSSEYLQVKEVLPIGRGEIVKMRTSSGTFIADGFPHHNCGDKKKMRELNYDHVVPRHLGGKTTWENIVSSCYPCNTKKRNRTPDQAGMKLLKQPHKPKTLPMSMQLRIDARSIPKEWEGYCSFEQDAEGTLSIVAA